MQQTPPPPATVSRKADPPPLNTLLQELSECLIAASEDSSNTQSTEPTQQGQTLASRMRNVLLVLVAQCIEEGVVPRLH